MTMASVLAAPAEELGAGHRLLSLRVGVRPGTAQSSRLSSMTYQQHLRGSPGGRVSRESVAESTTADPCGRPL